MMTAAKPVHHQLKRRVGLLESRVRGAGGGWPSRDSERGRSDDSIMGGEGYAGGAQPAKGEHECEGVRNARRGGGRVATCARGRDVISSVSMIMKPAPSPPAP